MKMTSNVGRPTPDIGGRRGRPWVLKSPLHLGFLDVIRVEIPGATLVQCHRDPRVSVPSNARLHELLWRMADDDVDRHRVGDVVLDFWSRAMADNLRQRDSPGKCAGIIDVYYQDIVTDALGAVRTVLDAHGVALSDAEAADIVRWEADNPQHRHGRHEYSQEAYGLTDARIEQAYEPYLRRFFGKEENL